MQYDSQKIHPPTKIRKVYVWLDFASDQEGSTITGLWKEAMTLPWSKVTKGMAGLFLSLDSQPTAPRINSPKKDGCQHCGRAPP